MNIKSMNSRLHSSTHLWKCESVLNLVASNFHGSKSTNSRTGQKFVKSEANIGQITNSQQRFQRGVLIGSESVKVCQCEFPIALIVEYLLTVP